jgi:hypothetical protein
MKFTHGQPVRIKDKQVVGTVQKKLTSLDDVYVVLVENASRATEERLVRGADLEPLASHESQKLA